MIPVARGKHRKPKENTTTKRIVAGAATIGMGTGIATLATVDARAATLDQWEAIAQCESGGDWSINYSSDGMSVGGLQFQNASWQAALRYLNSHGVDTSGWTQRLYQRMPRSQVPTKEQTVLAAEALLALQGPGAWVCKGQGLSASMFEGGPRPYGPATTYQSPKPIEPPKPKPRKVEPTVTPPAKAAVEYRVKTGDTLYDITKGFTGDAGVDNWRPLYEANRAKIGSNPDLIYPGQVFTLPWTEQQPETRPQKEKPTPATPPMSAGYQLPVKAPITQVYGNPGAGYTLGYHTGVDFGASYGTIVHAATGGTVVGSDPSSAYGLNVQIRNQDGTYSLYAHLSARTVSVGMVVKAGQQIGNVGNSGTNSTGAHLHFEIRTQPNFAAGNFMNPVTWLRKHGVAI
ncbi:peptidoglycan DD-metalloendopeptidase family protein [Streptomyces sp. NPDC057686]|uniref:peptidoglycan DD-metalloendopeptidase family protein n=1 Tax=Streptomyces sp. NPDC057686 TaxID=3346212 RepID=UPI0036974F81